MTRWIFIALLLTAYPFAHFRTGTWHMAFLYWMAHANLFHLAVNLFSGWMMLRKPNHLIVLLLGCIAAALLWPVPTPACGCSAGLYALAAYRIARRKDYHALSFMVASLALSALMPHMANTLHLGGVAVGLACAQLHKLFAYDKVGIFRFARRTRL